MNQRRSFFKNAAKASVLCFLSPIFFLKKSDASGTIDNGFRSALNNQLDLRSCAGLNGYLCIKGTVYNKVGLEAKPGVKIEILDSETGQKYSDGNSILITNESGEYRFLVDMPERKQGNAPRVKFAISSKECSYTSEIIVTEIDAFISDKHWEQNRELGDLLFPEKENFECYSQITLNLSA